eukprot:10659307-Alexandrium_andersonii.AAC.1
MQDAGDGHEELLVLQEQLALAAEVDHVLGGLRLGADDGGCVHRVHEVLQRGGCRLHLRPRR